jgi:hypothetical protein
MPVIETLINAAAGHKMLSFMDGNAGYNQIFMAPEDIHKTAFRVPGVVGIIRVRGHDFWAQKCWSYISMSHELYVSRFDRQAGGDLY